MKLTGDVRVLGNAQIIQRDVLLKFQYAFEFLADVAPEICAEVQESYCQTMDKLYSVRSAALAHSGWSQPHAWCDIGAVLAELSRREASAAAAAVQRFCGKKNKKSQSCILFKNPLSEASVNEALPPPLCSTTSSLIRRS
eukprot:SAG11_NODE_11048_length_787_cov_0.963663_2_plen_140_part_00